MYDYRARAYDPKIGRFVQNNPVKYTDPSGLTPNPAEAACAVGPNPVCIGGALLDLATTGMVLYYSYRGLQEEIEREANRREYKNICNEPPPPGLNGCDLAKWKLNKAKRCKDARIANTNRWWGGVDMQHSPQLMQDLDNAIRSAEAAVERLCKCAK